MDIIGINKISNTKQTNRINNVNNDIRVLNLATRTRSEILFWK